MITFIQAGGSDRRYPDYGKRLATCSTDEWCDVVSKVKQSSGKDSVILLPEGDFMIIEV